MDDDRWDLLNDDGTAVGQLARSFQRPAWRDQGSRRSSGHRLLVLQRQFTWKGDFREQLEPDNVLP